MFSAVVFPLRLGPTISTKNQLKMCFMSNELMGAFGLNRALSTNRGLSTIARIGGIGLSLLMLMAGGYSTGAAATDATAPAAVVVSITNPTSPQTVPPNGTVPITASVTGASTKSVVWTVTGALTGAVTNGNATIGTIPGTSTSAIYTAPSALPTGNNPVTITATSVADATKSASVTVTIVPSTTSPNAMNVPGNNTDATGVNLNIPASNPTLGLADVGLCTPVCSATVASVTISKGSNATVWLLGQGLTNASGTTALVSVRVSQPNTGDVMVSAVKAHPLYNGLTNVEFRVQVSAGATTGPRNIIVTNAAGELQAFIGAITIP